jgi:hypothetical protein
MFVIDGNGLGPLSGKFVWFSVRLQTEVQYEIRKAGKKYMTDVICDKDNTNKLWSYIKSKGQEFIGVAPLDFVWACSLMWFLVL